MLAAIRSRGRESAPSHSPSARVLRPGRAKSLTRTLEEQRLVVEGRVDRRGLGPLLAQLHREPHEPSHDAASARLDRDLPRRGRALCIDGAQPQLANDRHVSVSLVVPPDRKRLDLDDACGVCHLRIPTPAAVRVARKGRSVGLRAQQRVVVRRRRGRASLGGGECSPLGPPDALHGADGVPAGPRSGRGDGRR